MFRMIVYGVFCTSCSVYLKHCLMCFVFMFFLSFVSHRWRLIFSKIAEKVGLNKVPSIRFSESSWKGQSFTHPFFLYVCLFYVFFSCFFFDRPMIIWLRGFEGNRTSRIRFVGYVLESAPQPKKDWEYKKGHSDGYLELILLSIVLFCLLLAFLLVN